MSWWWTGELDCWGRAGVDHQSAGGGARKQEADRTRADFEVLVWPVWSHTQLCREAKYPNYSRPQGGDLIAMPTVSHAVLRWLWWFLHCDFLCDSSLTDTFITWVWMNRNWLRDSLQKKASVVSSAACMWTTKEGKEQWIGDFFCLFLLFYYFAVNCNLATGNNYCVYMHDWAKLAGFLSKFKLPVFTLHS